MRVFVFAYNRFDTMTTPNMLRAEGIPHIVLCHSEADRERFIANGTAERGSIVATGNPRGLPRQRNYALSLLKEGEWGLFLNDDLSGVTYLKDYYDTGAESIPVTTKNTTYYGKQFSAPATLKEFICFCHNLTMEAEKRRVYYAGFASNGNPLFRARRYRTQGLVDGRAVLVRKSALRFDESDDAGVIEDHFFTAENIKVFGKVLVDNWVLPLFKRNTEGGYGTIEERAPELRRACAYLLKKYPYLFKYKTKKGYPPFTQVAFVKI